MWKNIMDLQRRNMTIWSISPWVPKGTNTHSEYVILMDFPLQQWLHEHSSILRYKYIVYLFLMTQQSLVARASSLSRLHDHTQTHQGFSGRGIGPSHRPPPDNTQHSHHTDIHSTGGFRTRNISQRAAAYPRLRPRGHWDQRFTKWRNPQKYTHHFEFYPHFARSCVNNFLHRDYYVMRISML